jgi:hypothetical protein
MDPNAALNSLRVNTQEALRVVYDANSDRCGYSDMLTDLAEGFDNLDDHLRKGGFLPDDWAVDSAQAVEALKQAFPTLTTDFTDEWFFKVVAIVEGRHG